MLAAAGGGFHWLVKERDHSNLAIDLTLERLSVLNLASVETTGEWEVARTFNHLAQSIEFSMDGFPEMKSSMFRHTVGRLAFSAFQANGHMMHGLNEAIPGEVVIIDNLNLGESHRRLLAALERFESHDGPLEPHFAYGKLDRSQYAIAHVMHVNNHLEEFRYG